MSVTNPARGVAGFSGILISIWIAGATAMAGTGDEGRLRVQGALTDGPPLPLVEEIHRLADAGGRTLEVVLETGAVMRWGLPYDCDTAIPAPDDLLAAGPLQFLVAGDRHAVAVQGDGTIVGWGCDDFGQATVPEDLRGDGVVVVDLAAGENHTIALLEDGSVVCWGECTVPEEIDPANDHTAILVGAGQRLSFALRSDRTMVYWFGNGGAGQWDPKQLPQLKNVVDVVHWNDPRDTGSNGSLQGITADGDLLFASFPNDPSDPFVEIVGGDRVRLRRASGDVVTERGNSYDPRPGVGGVPSWTATKIVGGFEFMAMVPVSSDCDANGVIDTEQIAADPSIDCDRDGRIDACENDPGLGRDCNANGLADACEIFAGEAVDVDGDLVPDDCRPDCDGDAVPDAFAIESGLVSDCDGNAIPDECDFDVIFTEARPGTPVGPTDYLVFDVSSLPDARDTVTIEVSALGNLLGIGRFLFVYLDKPTIENRIGIVFGSGGADCLGLVETLEMPVGGWNDAGLDGSRSIIIAGSGLDSICGDDAYTGVTVTVPAAFDDCNGDGVWDACNIENGSTPDADGDGTMDVCDQCPADPQKIDPGICGCGSPDVGDADGDGILDCVDPCPTWPYDCSEDGQTIFVAVGEPILDAIGIAPVNGIVQLRAGTFETESTIILDGDGIRLHGTRDEEGMIVSTISGIDAHRVLETNEDVTNLLIKDLRISHGRADFGAGIFLNANGSATIIDCEFIANTATVNGGGVYAETGVDLMIDRAVFRSNIAENAGAGLHLKVGASTSVTESLFDSNTAIYGAGTYIDNATAEFSECTFDGNTASNNGGGAIGAIGTLNLSNCEFTNNTAGESGGGLYLSECTSQISGCEFSSNQSSLNPTDTGGGGASLRLSNTTIENCVFDTNTTGSEGAGLQVFKGTATITASAFSGNVAATVGGGVSIYQSTGTVLTDCTIVANTANGIDATNGSGGGIYGNESDPVSVFGCTIQDNTGGGILAWVDTNVVLQDTTVCGNGTIAIGGIGDFTDLGGNCISEVCDSDSDGTLDCVDGCPDDPDKIDPGQCGCGAEDLDTDADGISDCLDPCPTWPYNCSEDGETLFVEIGQSIQDALYAVPDGGTVDVAAGIFAITDVNGLFRTGGDFSIRGATDGEGIPTTILDAGGNGRLMTLTFGQTNATVIENLVLENGARDNAGGAVGLNNDTSPTFRNCRFQNNTAGVDGGAVHIIGGSPRFESCRFLANLANEEGGGIYALDASVSFVDCEFDGNTAVGGGAITFEGSTLNEVTNSTFRNNIADRGGAIYLGESGLVLGGSILARNIAPISGSAITVYQSILEIGTTAFCENLPATQISGTYTDTGGTCVIEVCGIDVDENDFPDVCEPDCNQDGIPDAYEIATGVDTDVNANGVPDSCDIMDGDLNVDGCVDAEDLGLILVLWGVENPPVGDLDGNGIVGASDLGKLLSLWRPCDP